MTISIQEICDAALKEFNLARRNPDRSGERRRQLHVDYKLQTDDLENMNIEEYTERCIKPAITMLAASVPEDVIFLDLEFPIDVRCARSGCLRFCTDTVFQAVGWDEITGGATEFANVDVARFDVLFELA